MNTKQRLLFAVLLGPIFLSASAGCIGPLFILVGGWPDQVYTPPHVKEHRDPRLIAETVTDLALDSDDDGFASAARDEMTSLELIIRMGDRWNYVMDDRIKAVDALFQAAVQVHEATRDPVTGSASDRVRHIVWTLRRGTLNHQELQRVLDRAIHTLEPEQLRQLFVCDLHELWPRKLEVQQSPSEGMGS